MGNGVDFESIKQNGYTNVLKYRGKNKPSGITYDYMEQLGQYVDKGIFEDAKKDSFTRKEKQALQNELFNIHKEHNYSTNFNSMRPGTKTQYSYDDFIRLANAAGYTLKEKMSEEVKPENVLKNKEKTPVSAASTTQPEVQKIISAEEKIKSELDADPELKGKDGKERKSILKGKIADLSIERYNLEKTTTTYQTKGFLGMFKKTKERDLTAEELTQRKEKIAEIDKKLDETRKKFAYVSLVEANDYWVYLIGPQELKDENGNIIAAYPQVRQVTLKTPEGKEIKSLRVDDYDPRTLKYNYKYYSVDVQKVGDPNIGYGPRYSIVPDMNNELVGYEEL